MNKRFHGNLLGFDLSKVKHISSHPIFIKPIQSVSPPDVKFRTSLDGERGLVTLDIAILVGLVNLIPIDLILGLMVLLVAIGVSLDDAAILLHSVGWLVVLDVAILILLINPLLLGC